MKLKIDTTYLWDDLTRKERINLIKELVLTEANCQEFIDKVILELEKLKIRGFD